MGDDMMRLLLAGVLLLGLGVAGGCATNGGTHTGNIHSLADQKLATEVYRRIRYDLPPEQATAIGVLAEGPVITLHGTVERPETRARAQSIAENTPGVTGVSYNITTRF